MDGTSHAKRSNRADSLVSSPVREADDLRVRADAPICEGEQVNGIASDSPSQSLARCRQVLRFGLSYEGSLKPLRRLRGDVNRFFLRPLPSRDLLVEGPSVLWINDPKSLASVKRLNGDSPHELHVDQRIQGYRTPFKRFNQRLLRAQKRSGESGALGLPFDAPLARSVAAGRFRAVRDAPARGRQSISADPPGLRSRT